jgi:hypothetical protein
MIRPLLFGLSLLLAVPAFATTEQPLDICKLPKWVIYNLTIQIPQFEVKFEPKEIRKQCTKITKDDLAFITQFWIDERDIEAVKSMDSFIPLLEAMTSLKSLHIRGQVNSYKFLQSVKDIKTLELTIKSSQLPEELKPLNMLESLTLNISNNKNLVFSRESFSVVTKNLKELSLIGASIYQADEKQAIQDFSFTMSAFQDLTKLNKLSVETLKKSASLPLGLLNYVKDRTDFSIYVNAVSEHFLTEDFVKDLSKTFKNVTVHIEEECGWTPDIGIQQTLQKVNQHNIHLIAQ